MIVLVYKQMVAEREDQYSGVKQDSGKVFE